MTSMAVGLWKKLKNTQNDKGRTKGPARIVPQDFIEYNEKE